MWTFLLFLAKKLGFFKFYGVSARIREERDEPVRTRKGGVNILDFSRTTFKDGP